MAGKNVVRTLPANIAQVQHPPASLVNIPPWGWANLGPPDRSVGEEQDSETWLTKARQRQRRRPLRCVRIPDSTEPLSLVSGEIKCTIFTWGQLLHNSRACHDS